MQASSAVVPLHIAASWLRPLALGAVLGLVVLGVGGRVVMRWLVADGASPSLTFSGTMTVVLSGLVSGLGGAFVRRLLDIRAALPMSVRRLLFAVFLFAITWRGLNPVDTSRLIAFVPLVVVYALLLEWRWPNRDAAMSGRDAMLD